MEVIAFVVDLFLRVDEHLMDIATAYGLWIYALLFLIVFLETGVVVTPFLPGDSLLFATGALAALGAVDIVLVLVLLNIAAILGDSVNYSIGRAIGPRVFTEHSRFLKHEHLMRTQRFYDRHGGKTIVLARFVPIIRTFAPFVAGPNWTAANFGTLSPSLAPAPSDWQPRWIWPATVLRPWLSKPMSRFPTAAARWYSRAVRWKYCSRSVSPIE
jgi:membrane protein DedA with SNARE-associated domain